MPRPGPRRPAYPIRASEDEIRPARELAEAEYGGNLSEAVRRIIAEWSRGDVLRPGDATTVHAGAIRTSATVKHLGNSSGPLIIIPDEVASPC